MIITTTVRGITVLAKLYKGEPTALTYANRSQAYAAAARVGGEVIRFGRPFLVKLPPNYCRVESPGNPQSEPIALAYGEEVLLTPTGSH